MVKYVQQNPDKLNDAIVHKFSVIDEYDPTLITIPDEFKDLSIDDVTSESFGRRTIKRKINRQRTDKNLAHYDAWRVSDRTMFKGDGKHPAIAKIFVAPSLLVKVFGMPAPTQIFVEGTGEYNFEDNNLDTYCLMDYRQTDFYHGLNREDEFYEGKLNRSK